MAKQCEFCGKSIPTTWESLCPSCYRLSMLKEIVYTKNGWKRVHQDYRYYGGNTEDDFIYEQRVSVLTAQEKTLFHEISEIISSQELMRGLQLFPKVSLSSIIEVNDRTTYQNELNRTIDFLIADAEFCPVMGVVVMKGLHLYNDMRKQRDNNLKLICDEACFPVFFIWANTKMNASKKRGEFISDLEKAVKGLNRASVF